MNPELLISFSIFFSGIVIGCVIAYLSIRKDAKDRGDSNLTIEAIIHELRTPLTGINWIFNSLLDLKHGDVINDDIETLIKEGVKKISNAIVLSNDALAALNTSIDYASYKFEKNDLVKVINKVIDENSLGAREKSIHVTFEADKEFQPFAFDGIKMTLAVRNLVSNAVKYTPAGGSVSVVARRNGRQAEVVVSDTGIGIPQADMGKIFGKFFRAKNIGDVSGSGLGLFIVRNIISGHGGRIDIQSNEGHGTKVTIFIPIK
ncbi:MAG: HAMP domain-containing sensor histidine kinase [bacterium]|nr:HAMP domain-containing sensor histidine kinase [bacterium]